MALLRLKRTLLKQEARILKRLEDLAIPKLYGYGRDENFEFFAIDLLGKSLADDDDEFVREFLIQEVANIGVQAVCWSVNDICR